MTKEEAIEWLKSLNYCDGEETQEVAQAIDMAIKALEQETSGEISKELKKRVFWEIGVPKERVAKELGCKTSWNTTAWIFTIDALEKHGFAICRTEGFLDD